ncbi:MAG: hemerythrin domain-containing protein [Proteobacteria bacterium]|nr:hemerythrin domain-containing protein [Pseudomonadota bacterium]
MELEHEAIRGQFLKIQNLPINQIHAREEQFEQLKDAINLHLDTEEQTLYSVLNQILPRSRLLREAQEEHHLIRTQVEQLARIPLDEPGWQERFEALSHLFIRHTLQEEMDIFPQAWNKLEASTQARPASYQSDNGMTPYPQPPN